MPHEPLVEICPILNGLILLNILRFNLLPVGDRKTISGEICLNNSTRSSVLLTRHVDGAMYAVVVFRLVVVIAIIIAA